MGKKYGGNNLSLLNIFWPTHFFGGLKIFLGQQFFGQKHFGRKYEIVNGGVIVIVELLSFEVTLKNIMGYTNTGG